jgi:hypothetical protein
VCEGKGGLVELAKPRLTAQGPVMFGYGEAFVAFGRSNQAATIGRPSRTTTCWSAALPTGALCERLRFRRYLHHVV